MDKEFFKGINLDEDISEEDFQYIVESWEKVQDFLSKEELSTFPNNSSIFVNPNST